MAEDSLLVWVFIILRSQKIAQRRNTYHARKKFITSVEERFPGQKYFFQRSNQMVNDGKSSAKDRRKFEVGGAWGWEACSGMF